MPFYKIIIFFHDKNLNHLKTIINKTKKMFYNWENSIKFLKVGGRMVTCGATTGPQGITDIRYIYSKQLSILGSYMASKNELIEVLKFVQLNKLKPVVDTILPLQKAAQAHKLMEERKHFGKIVLFLIKGPLVVSLNTKKFDSTISM